LADNLIPVTRDQRYLQAILDEQKETNRLLLEHLATKKGGKHP
jgi:hypothetical protein